MGLFLFISFFVVAIFCVNEVGALSKLKKTEYLDYFYYMLFYYVFFYLE